MSGILRCSESSGYQEKLHLLSSHWGALRQTRGMAWLMMSSLQCPGRKKITYFGGNPAWDGVKACLKVSICLYSTGRDALTSVFHFVTVNSHQSGGLINLLLLKMPKHFSCAHIKIAYSLLSFFSFVICTNHLGYNHIWRMTSSLVIIVKLVICSAWVITACQLVAAEGFSQQFEQRYQGL